MTPPRMVAPHGARLASWRVLVIEDDYFIASELSQMLQQNGAEVLGPVGCIEDGRRLARELAPDCVLLDLNLRGEHAFELVDDLRERGVAIILTTGYDTHALPERMRDVPCVRKPVDLAALVERIRSQPRRRPGS